MVTIPAFWYFVGLKLDRLIYVTSETRRAPAKIVRVLAWVGLIAVVAVFLVAVFLWRPNGYPSERVARLATEIWSAFAALVLALRIRRCQALEIAPGSAVQD